MLRFAHHIIFSKLKITAMRHFLLLLLLSTTVTLHAQLKIEWQQQFGGNGDDQARSIIQTTDGGYITIGLARDVPSGLLVHG